MPEKTKYRPLVSHTDRKSNFSHSEGKEINKAISRGKPLRAIGLILCVQPLWDGELGKATILAIREKFFTRHPYK